jgi:hypothetical protein
LCGLLGRVPQTPCLLSSAGNPKDVVWGAVFLGYFLFRQLKESNSPRGEKECYLGKAAMLLSLIFAVRN